MNEVVDMLLTLIGIKPFTGNAIKINTNNFKQHINGIKLR